jgi:hypothetical protein
MSRYVPDHSEIAPLGIVLAPVTIFYIFFGTNHLLMFLFLLISITLRQKKMWVLSGLFAAIGCYKFMLFPTVFVLFILVIILDGWKNGLKFLLGGTIFLIPNLIYYLFDQNTFLRILQNQAAIGAHSQSIEPFNFFYPLTQFLKVKVIKTWYINEKIWLILSLAGVPISLWLYKIKRLNFLQTLACSYAFIAIFAPEPFRLEPFIGLLWLDAVIRGKMWLKTMLFIILFTHAFAWFDFANSRILVFDPSIPEWLWIARGTIIGFLMLLTLIIIIADKNSNPNVLPSKNELQLQ